MSPDDITLAVTKPDSVAVYYPLQIRMTSEMIKAFEDEAVKTALAEVLEACENLRELLETKFFGP